MSGGADTSYGKKVQAKGLQLVLIANPRNRKWRLRAAGERSAGRRGSAGSAMEPINSCTYYYRRGVHIVKDRWMDGWMDRWVDGMGCIGCMADVWPEELIQWP